MASRNSPPTLSTLDCHASAGAASSAAGGAAGAAAAGAAAASSTPQAWCWGKHGKRRETWGKNMGKSLGKTWENMEHDGNMLDMTWKCGTQSWQNAWNAYGNMEINWMNLGKHTWENGTTVDETIDITEEKHMRKNMHSIWWNTWRNKGDKESGKINT